MKVLQTLFFATVIATTSMATFSTAAVAAEKKEHVSPTQLLDDTVAKIQAAIAAVDAGEKSDAVMLIIKEARQIQKDVIVGALDLKRQKASAMLINASRAMKEGDTKAGRPILENAVVAYKELSEMSKTQ